MGIFDRLMSAWGIDATLPESHNSILPLLRANSCLTRTTASYVITNSYSHGHLQFHHQAIPVEKKLEPRDGVIQLLLASTQPNLTQPNLLYQEASKQNELHCEFRPYEGSYRQSAEIGINLPLLEKATPDVDIRSQSKVEFQMPSLSHLLNRLKITTTSSRIKLANSHVGQAGLALESSSGNIAIKNVVVDTCATLKCSSGEIQGNDISVAGTLSAQTSSGDIEMHLKSDAVANEIDVRTSSGDISVSSAVSNQLTFETCSGDMILSKLRAETWVDKVGQIHAQSTSGDIKVLEPVVNGMLRVNTTSGDAEVYLKEKSFQGSINLQTSSGDIRVKRGKQVLDDVMFSECSEQRWSGQINCAGASKDAGEINISTTSGDITVIIGDN